VIGTGITWAVGWAALLGGFFALIGFPWHIVRILAFNGAFGGFFAGSVFAVVLSITERNRSLEDLSLSRVALWGGVGGVLAYSLAGLVLGFGPVVWADLLASAVLASGSASGSVALARRAEPTLIEGDDGSPFMLNGN
jgi:hypothetical protein